MAQMAHMVQMPQVAYLEYNPWWEEKYEPPYIIDRPVLLEKLDRYVEDERIVILTGLRRIGKSTVMKMLIRNLLRRGVDARDIFYVSLDDYALDSRSILDIVEEYRVLQALPVERKVYLFLDEVAYKDRFHQQLKTLFDRQNVKVVASSSSSSVLRDKGAFLTGREIMVKLFPLDFTEYLDFRGIKIRKRDRHLVARHFEEYMQTGGLPGYVLNRDRGYLKTVVNDIIYKDIIAYHNIRNQQVVKEFFLLLMERAGKQLSINKISNILKISPDTAKRYLGYFQDVYLVYPLSRHGTTNEQVLSPQKMYAPDLGIRHLYTGFRDKGSIFENYIFLLLLRRNPDFINYIYENGIELDFFIDKRLLVEVKYYRTLNNKQERLFQQFPAEEKQVIESIEDIDKLEGIDPGNVDN
jgi:predicted AAA+ superfamily ATPase